MIIRIVKMTFREDCVNEFTTIFEARKHIISSFPGCTHLELWQDNAHPNIFFTYSKWDSIAHLDHYRFSEFFKDTWGKTKVLFADKAEAWSLNAIL
jgi:quinol monooxygenase YgiN